MPKKTKNEKSKQLLASLLAVVFVFTTFLFSVRLAKAEEIFDDVHYINEEGYEYIFGEVTWGKGDHIIEKGVTIEEGGVLKIEKGARILFRDNPDQQPYLIVGDGKILAIGTQDEKITFASTEENGLYDIRFNSFIDGETSFFRYVDFIGANRSYDDEMSLKKNFFINTAVAAEVQVYNYFSYISGKVHIENSTFFNETISVDTYIGREDDVTNLGYNENGFIEIVNSNFDLTSGGLAIDSVLRCHEYFSEINCKKRFLLKNNWYGDFLGPNAEGSTLSNGVGLNGNYLLERWRGNDLIADPTIVVPGIMGSGQFLGSWQLDPITHSYDDLVASLEENGFIKDVNLFDFPYDWRNNNQTSARFLQSRIEGIISETKVSKVDVVAHSMGGLVARAYIEEIDGVQYLGTIDQLITMGTPQKGSPSAYLKWEAGEGFFTWSDKLAKHHFNQEAQHAGFDDLKNYLQEKVPSVNQLLPDYAYLIDAGSGQVRTYPENYPRNTFLEDLNLEANLEKMKKVEHINIFGKLESDQSTISKIRLVQSEIAEKWEHGMPEKFYDDNTDQGLEFYYGDETVPKYSAESISAYKMIEIDSSHQYLPTASQCEVLRELTGKTECNFVDDWHMTNVLLFNVFSPVDIQIISPSGVKYGKNFENDTIFENEDGSFYSGFETENEFLTIPNPEDGEYRIITKGTGEGGEFRIEAVKVSQDPNDETKSNESVETMTGISVPNEIEEKTIEIVGEKIVGEDVAEEAKDEIAPEAKISFNPATQKLEIVGIDNVSQNVSVSLSEQVDKRQKITQTAVLTDLAGNATTLVFEKKKDKDHRIEISLLSISYNGVTQEVTGASLTYKWHLDQKKASYAMFASKIGVSSETLESHFRPKENITVLMQKPQDLDSSIRDDADSRPIKEEIPGMTIFGFETKKGQVKISRQ